MVDSLRMVRDRAVELERQLDRLGAHGRGLGEKYRSLDLPPHIAHDLRQVNHLRNQVMHDGLELSLDDAQRFEQAAGRASVCLSELMPSSARKRSQIQTMHGWRIRRYHTTLEQKFALVTLIMIVAGYVFGGFGLGTIAMLCLLMIYGVFFPDRRRKRRRRR